MIALGIDIGGTAVKAAARKDGRVIWAAQSPFYAKPTTEELRAAIRQTVAGRLTDLHTVGLCVPGLFDTASRSISMAVNVPGLVGISLDHFVPDTLGLIVDGSARILNDARAAAHDIYSTRQMKGRLLVLALGMGVGIPHSEASRRVKGTPRHRPAANPDAPPPMQLRSRHREIRAGSDDVCRRS